MMWAAGKEGAFSEFSLTLQHEEARDQLPAKVYSDI